MKDTASASERNCLDENRQDEEDKQTENRRRQRTDRLTEDRRNAKTEDRLSMQEKLLEGKNDRTTDEDDKQNDGQ